LKSQQKNLFCRSRTSYFQTAFEENGNYQFSFQTGMEIHHLTGNGQNDYYKNIYHHQGWIKAPDGFYDMIER